MCFNYINNNLTLKQSENTNLKAFWNVFMLTLDYHQ